jgi:hypothetical protein
VYFSYSGCAWKATIKRERSEYNGHLVDFINIKLPNDGYFYTAEYNNGNGSLVEDKQEAFSFVDGVADSLLHRGLLQKGISPSPRCISYPVF